ncbi:MAG TPA: tannase/feruloyl esterase family alpha/beta hydrolase [Vicinamibacterales bacterium]|nr:tannase/feruloyl esterase family alpha/beta hydrolase [Vicinamibacterales bacterium]
MRCMAALGCFALIVATATAASAQNACADRVSRVALPQTTIITAVTIPAGLRLPADDTKTLGAFCEVVAAIRPTPGSRIQAVYRLPENWNGKVLGIGGGGFAGNVTLQGAADGLSRGYAVIENDLGHPSASALDPSFAILPSGQPNVDGIVDFGHRATHLATVVGKQLVAAYYGRQADRAYWQGCSTGGRQGLAEVQRYPDDYDGVIAGAPVYSPLTYSNAILRVQAFHKNPANNLTPAQVPLIHDAVLAACDAKDGVTDGILTDPRSCTWDPGVLACKAGQASDTCLTPAQVETVRRVYDGVKTTGGQWAAMPLMRGGESDWVGRMIGTPRQPLGLNAVLGAPFMAYIVKHDPAYDVMSFDPDRDLASLDSGLAGSDVNQEKADIAPFIRRGGKLLLWHGFNDPGPSPLTTIDYYDRVLKSVPSAQADVRLFLAPGVLHCGGGAGPDRFDTLTAMEQWVEHGRAPASMVATKANAPISRPLCPYPQLARYKGTGDPNDAQNFVCGR